MARKKKALKVGDFVKFNYQGRRYEGKITATASDQIEVLVDGGDPQNDNDYFVVSRSEPSLKQRFLPRAIPPLHIESPSESKLKAKASQLAKELYRLGNSLKDDQMEDSEDWQLLYMAVPDPAVETYNIAGPGYKFRDARGKKRSLTPWDFVGTVTGKPVARIYKKLSGYFGVDKLPTSAPKGFHYVRAFGAKSRGKPHRAYMVEFWLKDTLSSDEKLKALQKAADSIGLPFYIAV